MRTLFVLTTMVFLTFPLLAIEIGSVPGPEEIKAAQENFINVYQAVTDQAIVYGNTSYRSTSAIVAPLPAPISQLASVQIHILGW